MKRAVVSVLIAVFGLTARPGFGQSAGFACTGAVDACQFVRHFIGALNERNWDAFRACLADDVTVLFDRPAPPERQDGRQAVEALFRRAFPASGAGPSVAIARLDPEDVLVQSEGSAA